MALTWEQYDDAMERSDLARVGYRDLREATVAAGRCPDCGEGNYAFQLPDGRLGCLCDAEDAYDPEYDEHDPEGFADPLTVERLGGDTRPGPEPEEPDGQNPYLASFDPQEF